MSKRFTDTEKWNDPWFRNMSNEHKLLWYYLCDNCDNAGIWKVDFGMAEFKIRCKYDYKETLSVLNSDRMEGEFRVLELMGGRYWFIYGFYSFQWGKAKDNSVLRGVHNTLMKHKFYEEIVKYIPSLNGGSTEGQRRVHPPKVKEKEKEKVKDKGGVGGFRKPTIEEIRAYCLERKNNIDPEYFFNKYESNGWVDKNGNRMKNWKATIVTWEKWSKGQVGRTDDGLTPEIRASLAKLKETNAKLASNH